MTFPGLNLQRWAGVLAGRAATDQQGQDSAREAADALAEVLDAEDLERLVDALLEAAPGLRERFSDTMLTELKEELIRREDAKHVHATITLIEQIEADWKNEQ